MAYNTVRHALYAAVAEGYVVRTKQGIYRFKSMSKVLKVHRDAVRNKTRAGNNRIKGRCEVSVMTYKLLDMDSMQFRGLVAATGVKHLCQQAARNKRTTKRYHQQIREKGFWDMNSTDEDTGEIIRAKGTAEDLKPIEHWAKTNCALKIPLTGKESFFKEIEAHVKINNKVKDNHSHPEGKGEATGNVGSTAAVGTISGLCIRPIGPDAQSSNDDNIIGILSIAICASQLTQVKADDAVVERTGYFTKTRSGTQLKLSTVKASPATVAIGPKQAKPFGIRTSKIQRRYRKYRFKTMGEKDVSKPLPTEFSCEQHVYVKPASNRNIARVIGVSETAVRNQALTGFGGTAESRKHIFVLGPWTDSSQDIADKFNSVSKTMPHDLQFSVFRLKANSLSVLIGNGTSVSQVGLTGFVNLDHKHQDLLVLRLKSTVVFVEERHLKKNAIENRQKTLVKEVCPLSGKENLSVRAFPLSNG